MGGLWLTTHLYRHYLYTGDPEYLAEIYPVYQACAAFILDYVYQEEEGYQSCPSTSPENTFYDDQGRECAACVSSTMDIVLIREVLSNLLEIEKILLGKTAGQQTVPGGRKCTECASGISYRQQGTAAGMEGRIQGSGSGPPSFCTFDWFSSLQPDQ